MRKSLLIIWMILTPVMAVIAQEEKADSTIEQQEQVAAQYFLDHHLNFNLGGGLHTMFSDPIYGDSKIGFGGMFEARYEIVPKVVGFGTGLKLTLRNATTTTDYKEQELNYTAENGQNAKYTYLFKEWEEKENMFAVEIPVQLVISTGATKPTSFHAAIGASFSLPIAGKYKPIEGEHINYSVYFDQTKVEYIYNKGFKDHEHLGLYPADEAEKGKIKYAIGVNAIVDLGILKKITDQCALYIGLYGSYGLLNACKQESTPLYNAQKHEYVGLYSSNQVTKITPIEAGLKVGFYLSFHDTEKEIAETNKILDERVKNERQEAEAAAAKRAAKVEEKGRKQELEKGQQERKDKELVAVNEASRQEALDALKAIKNAAKYANVNASPLFPKEADPYFLIVRKYLETNPESKIIITGHTDNSSTPAKNIVNGQHRAEAFKNALVRKNIPRNRIGCVSKGETEPIASNDTPEGREKNRRVELDLVDAGASSTNDATINEEDTEEELRIGGKD